MKHPLETVWEAINSMERPVTAEAVLQVAKNACMDAKKDPAAFENWFKTNGRLLVEIMNRSQDAA